MGPQMWIMEGGDTPVYVKINYENGDFCRVKIIFINIKFYVDSEKSK